MAAEKLPLALTEEESIQQLVKDSDLIFTGTLLAAGTAPDSWSGGSNSYQSVRYKIDKILKGQYGSPEISVDHVVVYGGKTARSGEIPGLSDQLFAPKAKLIVGAQRTDTGSWKALDEDYSALPATDDWLRKIQKEIGQ